MFGYPLVYIALLFLGAPIITALWVWLIEDVINKECRLTDRGHALSFVALVLALGTLVGLFFILPTPYPGA